MSSDPAVEIEAILAQYDLGELVDYERNTRGFINTSYAIVARSGSQETRYFLRRYKKGIREEELQFEHSLIDHLVSQGLSGVARLIKVSSGGTYLRWKGGSAGFPADSPAGDLAGDPGEFIAIFQFLSGEDRYTWVSPGCNEAETVEAAGYLGRFHSAVSGFTPQGRRSEAKILELLPLIARNMTMINERSKHTAFDETLSDHLAEVLRHLEDTRRELAAHDLSSLPELVVHCDYHPGNLKFQEGKTVGLFDFDWSKIDLRLFDVALAIWYFCTSWQGETDGQLRIDQASRFLVAYQRTMRVLPGVGPLSQAELATLPVMLAASNLYVLNWTVEDYYQKEVDLEEYLQYLRHGLRFIRWFESLDARQSLDRLTSPRDHEFAQE